MLPSWSLCARHSNAEVLSSSLLALQVNQQQRDGGGSDAADARGLAHGLRARLLELEQHLGGEAAHAVIVEVGGDRRVLVAALAFDLLALAFQVASVLRYFAIKIKSGVVPMLSMPVSSA